FADGSATRPCILIGDLALQHDLTSLALCAQRGAVVVVVNNDGGGIFSYLPIREHTDVFEPWFGTPHGQGFERAAAHFGLDYAQPRSVDELESQLGKAFSEGKGYVIEITTDRQDNLEEQRRLLRALGDRIDAIIEDGGSA
ncbi:MAG: thiamine pyrophosphate-dependent enzyme, partial [Rhodothermales bacterium]